MAGLAFPFVNNRGTASGSPHFVFGHGQTATKATTGTRGDSVTISPEAREALREVAGNTAANASSGLIGSGALALNAMEHADDSTLVAKAVTSSGRQIIINRATPRADAGSQNTEAAGDDAAAAYTLTVLDNSGQEERVLDLTGDVILGENADGSLSVDAYAPGKETSGDDIIIAASGGVMHGGDGNDTLIALNSTRKMEIDGGDGNDTVYVEAGDAWTGHIDTGAGNDQVVAKGLLLNSVINTGDGDDSVDAGDLSAVGTMAMDAATGELVFVEESNSLSVDTGEGNDTVSTGTADATREGIIRLDITTGGGNDAIASDNASIDRGGYIATTIDAGDGDDTISTGDAGVSWKGVIKTTVDAGSGNDAIDIGDAATGWDGSIEMDIDAGDGDDTVRTGSLTTGWGGAIDLRIRTGKGNDAVSTGPMTTGQGGSISAAIDTGDGDDSVSTADMAAGLKGNIRSRIETGKGDDSVDLGAMTAFDGSVQSTVSTGRGDDIVTAEASEATGAGFVQSAIRTDAGDDTLILDVLADQQASGRAIMPEADTGDGKDRLVWRYLSAMRRGDAA
ncbi:hypothetical protein K9F62_20210 [Desulfovibrio sp. JY]|nr:hypothetical protein K9F62_20210 [Desulfovibrio sp. JY]